MAKGQGYRSISYVDKKGMLTWDMYDVENGLKLFDEYVYRKVHESLEKSAEEMVNYAQSNRPWQDRTKAARYNIHADIQEKSGYGSDSSKAVLGIQLSHGVKYGLYLERGTKWNPRTGRPNRPYPILEPTVRLYGPQVVQNLKGILGNTSL